MSQPLATQTFTLPDLGEGLTEAEIVGWRVAVGDEVEIDQVVADVETAKAAVEVPVPFAGTVVAIHAEVGVVLAVGQPLISVGAGGQAGVALTNETSAEGAEEEGSGHVLIGYGTAPHGPPRRRRVRPGPPSHAPERVDPAPAPANPPSSLHPPARPGPPAGSGPVLRPAPAGAAPLVVSPLVRRQAAKHGIDVATLVPSGRGGVVLRRDVEAAIVARAAPPAETVADRVHDEERIPLRGARRVIAEKLSRSRTEIPDVTTWVDVDATGLMAAKDSLRGAGHAVSLLALVAKCCVAGLARFGDLNASVDTERGEIVRRRDIHLGFAAQTERGLFVPVIHHAEVMTTVELAAELARLTELARAGRLSTGDLTGGTFTLNNYGVFGVDGSTPIINHPEAALLGMGRIIDKPWVHEGQVAVRKVTQLSLTFDHRVCDGGTAGGYLRFVADAVENPMVLLAGL